MTCPDCDEILEPLTTQWCDECYRPFCTECCKPRTITVLVGIGGHNQMRPVETSVTCAACEPEDAR